MVATMLYLWHNERQGRQRQRPSGKRCYELSGTLSRRNSHETRGAVRREKIGIVAKSRTTQTPRHLKVGDSPQTPAHGNSPED